MDDYRLSFPACVIAGKPALDAEDLERLRRYAYPDGIRSERDVFSLLAINNLCPDKCGKWHDYVVESVTAFVVDVCHPHGMVDDANAEWLTRFLASDGAIHSVVELDIVLHVLETARAVPESLATLALDQLRLAVCEGRGAYRHMRSKPDGGVDLSDLRYIYRILRGSVARGRVLLPAEQLRCLLRIDAETAIGRPHHPGWHELLAAISPLSGPGERRGQPRWLNIPDKALLEGAAAA